VRAATPFPNETRAWLQAEARRGANPAGCPQGLRHGLQLAPGRLAEPAVRDFLKPVTLIDASVIGASAVSLSTAYAIGDVLSLKHSLHRKLTDAKGFYAVHCGLIAAGLVLTPGAPASRGVATKHFAPPLIRMCRPHIL
jgi:hypothetical protein